MTVFCRRSRDTKAREVTPLEQHAAPLMVIVHGVVDRDVHRPHVSVLVGVKQRWLVLNALRYTVGQTAVGAVISCFQPRVRRQCLVGEAADVVEQEGDRSVDLLVRVIVQVRTDIEQGWTLAVQEKRQRRAVDHQVPVLARSCLDPHVQLPGEGFGCIQQGMLDLPCWQVKPLRTLV